MAYVSHSEGHRFMGVITKQHRGGVIAGDAHTIVTPTTCLRLVQSPYELLDHDIHTLQILDLRTSNQFFQNRSTSPYIRMCDNHDITKDSSKN